MNNKGFTVLELMVALSISVGAMTTLYYLNLSMTRVTIQQERAAILRDEARITLQSITRMLRMANAGTMKTLDKNGDPIPLGRPEVDNVQFQMVADADDNGSAMNPDNSVGLSELVRFAVDKDDLNGDGETTTQLVQFDKNANIVRVFSHHLEDPQGIRFQRTRNGLRVKLSLYMPELGNKLEARSGGERLVSIRN